MHPLIPTRQDIPAISVGAALSAGCAVALLLAVPGAAPPVAGHHYSPPAVQAPVSHSHAGTSKPAQQPGQQPGYSGGYITVSDNSTPSPSPEPQPSTSSPAGSGTPAQKVTTAPPLVEVSPSMCVTAIVVTACLPEIEVGG